MGRYAHDPSWPDAARGMLLLLRSAGRYGLARDKDDGSMFSRDGWLFSLGSRGTQDTAQDAPSMDIVNMPPEKPSPAPSAQDLMSMSPEQQMEEYKRLCREAGIDIDASLEALDKSTETTDAR